jgi:photosystem II stability/assembly factor-like uncharacterized protein
MRKLFCVVIILISQQTFSQTASPFFSAMQWRCIGPHRGGRTIGAVGVPSQPNVFYIGVNNGGVWKTNDFGRTWFPIFDDQPTGSVGDIAVSASNPNVIYVGSGEGVQRPDLSVGDGMYRSSDGGKSWKHLGLSDAQQIGGLALDPNDENRLFVAALGHPYGPNTERGIYRTTDGGAHWEKVLYKDENTGGIQVAIDPQHSNIVYAALWAGRQGPWENGAWNGPESGLFKSTDGGTTWKKLITGLPTTQQGLGRIGFAIAPSDDNRIYATVDAGANGGVYRSDDAGETWRRIQSDQRYWGRGSDFAELKVDPLNRDILYSANVVTWKSTDGGMNWSAFRGAPGGDDYHRLWINPTNPDIILIASDQGALITVNGGQTYSSWYNQPTAQFYHVSTDNAFPYNVYGAQQESGSVGIASRSNDGEISFREWHPVGVEEYGYVAADPLDPNIIFGGKISRYDKRTGQIQNISPESVRSGKYRFLRTAPVLFSPIDPKTLFFAGNVLFKTTDGGNSWKVLSPDLTRDSWDIPASVGIYTTEDLKKMPRRGVIYTVAPSFKDINTIWAGTDDGLMHVTRDGGKTWKNITPSGVTSWSKVSMMEAGHFDVNTAYAAVNRIRCDDMHPHIYRTHDGGKTWQEIVNGLPDDPVNTVREDPEVKGLLFAGNERAVYVSFDDGDHWQSLRLNMPATSIRDLVIKDDDIVVGTHGRSFWILDNITPLRQRVLSNKKKLFLFYAQTAYRVRWDMYPDTPVPQEEPAGQNPPDGAMIDYYLENDLAELTIDIYDAKNNLVRRYSSHDTLYSIPPNNIPPYWIRPQQILQATSGDHRFLWDLHYQPLNLPPSYPISATYMNTAPDPTSPWVMPGTYIVKMITREKDGKTTELVTGLKVKMDPRVKTSVANLQLQHNLSWQCYEARKKIAEALQQIRFFRAQLRSQMTNPPATVADGLNKKDQQAALLESTPPGKQDPSFSRLANSFGGLFNTLQESDMPPTTQTIAAVKEANAELNVLLNKWAGMRGK